MARAVCSSAPLNGAAPFLHGAINIEVEDEDEDRL